MYASPTPPSASVGYRKLFSPLLERMDKTRSLRSARLMLQRLAKVLDVPGRMAKFMKVRAYHHHRWKALYGPCLHCSHVLLIGAEVQRL